MQWNNGAYITWYQQLNPLIAIQDVMQLENEREKGNYKEQYGDGIHLTYQPPGKLIAK